MSRKPLLILLGAVGVLVLATVLFAWLTGTGRRTAPEAANFKPVMLEYWGVYEEPEAISMLTRPHRQSHPKISINYRTFREDEYKTKLLEGWALGQGPDLFMIPNTKIREYLGFIEPMPNKMTAPVEYMAGTIRKEKITEMRTYNGFTPKQIKDQFLDIVGSDVIIGEKIYGLPFSLDVLTVFYNNALLKANNIALPAKTWREVLEHAAVISKANTKDEIIQSAIAMGATNNSATAFDVINTLLIQTNIPMGDASGPLFQNNLDTLKAIEFYLSFTRPGLKNYSWSSTMPDALDAFTAGKLAYFIGYPYHAQLIRAVNPQLNFDIQPIFLPDLPESVVIAPQYATYWVTVVAKPPKGASAEKKKRAELAWQFLVETLHNKKTLKSYLYRDIKYPRATVLKELVSEQSQDPTLGPFAQSLLHVTSWYRGYNFDVAKKKFLEMITNIDEAYRNGTNANLMLRAGADLIRQTYRTPQ